MRRPKALPRTLLAALLAAGLGLAGCASQGPSAPPGPEDALIGYWTIEGGGSGETVAEFREDGTFRVFVREAGQSQRHSGKFRVEGDRIRFAGKQGAPAETQYALQGDRLQYAPTAGGTPAWMIADTWRRMGR